jgi:hypothetical protein
MRKLFHFIGLQAAWCAAALLASTDWHLLGAAANALFVAVHLVSSKQWSPELRRAGNALTLGLIVEVFNARVGHVAAAHAGALPPPWLLSLWPAFASSFMPGLSLAWLRERPYVAAGLGAVLGPVSYAGGARLGALELEGLRSLVCLSAAWAVAMPVLARLDMTPRSGRPLT